jgi:hypothetical protein
MKTKGQDQPAQTLMLRVARLAIRVRPPLARQLWKIAGILEITPDEVARRLVAGEFKLMCGELIAFGQRIRFDVAEEKPIELSRDQAEIVRRELEGMAS